MTMVQPPAEMSIDEILVRGLLTEQHGDLAHLPLQRMDAGWDNDLWRLGDALIVRLPRRSAAVALTLNEQRWLPVIADALPLPVPTPVRVGRPGAVFPWPWSVVPFLYGEPGDRSPLRVRAASNRLAMLLDVGLAGERGRRGGKPAWTAPARAALARITTS